MPAQDVQLKDDLLRACAFEQLRPTQVTLLETHISWVFLLDHDVFKVKKPVNLGFLDFSTVARRKEACEAEVRLNTRLAGDVYRGVVPVRRGGDGRCMIGGTGRVIDWAVHMVRLSDELRADRLLQRGQLFEADIDALAVRLAAFHAAQPSDEATAAFGTLEIVRGNIEENFAQTRDAIGAYISPAESREIASWQGDFVRDHEGLFEQRRRSGKIRDGHGDLRLEHVYFQPSSPTVIDCIEFNERFRFADVCADIAFLSMDLILHGRVDLAERLLASYAREADDYDLYALVDFYESYRAFVRAKVSAMTAADEGIDRDTRDRAHASARRHFLLALAAERRSLMPPVLVIVGGVLASGKSTIAGAVSAHLSAPIVSADRTRKAMVGVPVLQPLHHAAWQGAYDTATTSNVYAEVLRRAGIVLASGRSVVVDASFRSSAMRRAARELARSHGVRFAFVECEVDREVCRARLRDREASVGISDGRLAIFDAFCAEFEPITELVDCEHSRIDTSRTLDENMTRLREHLDVLPPGLRT